jgi:hypothetical protein
LAASRRRYWGRRALAATLALPVGVLGAISTPLGHRVGAGWLVHPGRRLHARLAGDARTARGLRDEAIRAEHHAALAAEEAERTTDGAAPRAPQHHNPDSISTGGEMTAPHIGFLFEESASEMENAALTYNPAGAMHVLGTVEGFPAALTSIANTFRILAERCDSAFPVNPDVGQAIADIHNRLIQAVGAAEDAYTTFRASHADDIARHEDPRNNEPMWDTNNN